MFEACGLGIISTKNKHSTSDDIEITYTIKPRMYLIFHWYTITSNLIIAKKAAFPYQTRKRMTKGDEKYTKENSIDSYSVQKHE